MSDSSTRQQVVEKLKQFTNILVTVSKDPTVDSLSAAIGLTELLNKIDKHTTAVVSSHVPKSLQFLEPGKTFEDSTDSLRDFIISLDISKADHLKYNVEGDFVKIFITPYRYKLSEKDLEFSQGDYNVQLVVALGVTDRDSLDKALESHGKILHDAPVISITAGDKKSSLGSIDWHDDLASSLCEMVAELVEKLSTEDKPLLDEKIATALLTGIVSETERFSNQKTTSKAMNLAAKLMSAGANQQLIVVKLAEEDEPKEEPKPEELEKTEDELTDELKQATEELEEAGSDGTLNLRAYVDKENKAGEVSKDNKTEEKSSSDATSDALEKELKEIGVETTPEMPKAVSVEELLKEADANRPLDFNKNKVKEQSQDQGQDQDQDKKEEINENVPDSVNEASKPEADKSDEAYLPVEEDDKKEPEVKVNNEANPDGVLDLKNKEEQQEPVKQQPVEEKFELKPEPPKPQENLMPRPTFKERRSGSRGGEKVIQPLDDSFNQPRVDINKLLSEANMTLNDDFGVKQPIGTKMEQKAPKPEQKTNNLAFDPASLPIPPTPANIDVSGMPPGFDKDAININAGPKFEQGVAPDIQPQVQNNQENRDDQDPTTFRLPT